MKYIDAGYISALSVLFVYSAWLLYRRRRLERTGGSTAPGAETARSQLERRAAGQ